MSRIIPIFKINFFCRHKPTISKRIPPPPHLLTPQVGSPRGNAPGLCAVGGRPGHHDWGTSWYYSVPPDTCQFGTSIRPQLLRLSPPPRKTNSIFRGTATWNKSINYFPFYLIKHIDKLETILMRILQLCWISLKTLQDLRKYLYWKRPGVKLTIHLPLLTRIRNVWAISPLPHLSSKSHV
jgi:hypothetical protein